MENQELETDTIGEPETEFKWIKYGSFSGMTVVGKDVIAGGSGCHMSMLDPLAGRILRYSANSKAVGDGVRCVTGHRSVALLAFAELALSSRIFVLSYPELKTVVSFADPTVTSYISISFGEMEVLLTLSGVPQFKVTVWRWRTGEQLANMTSGMSEPIQCLRCSLTSPTLAIQSSPNSRMLLMWETQICFKRCLLLRHEVHMPSKSAIPFDTTWAPDGGLYVVDGDSNLFTVEADRSTRLVWPGKPGSHPPIVASYRGGVLVMGSDAIMRMLRRGARGWTVAWSLMPLVPITQLMSLGPKEHLVATSNDVETCELSILMWNEDPANPQLTTMYKERSQVDELCLVLPLGEFVVGRLGSENMVAVWEIEKGIRVSVVPMRPGDRVVVMRANPSAPIIAFGRPQGGVELISLFVPTAPVTLFTINLAECVIDALEFSASGNILVAVSQDTGSLFFIKLQPGMRIEVVAHMVLGSPIASWTLIELEHELQIVMILRTVGCCAAGDVMATLVLVLGTWALRMLPVAKLPNVYTQLVSTGLAKRLWLGVPHRSRQLHTLKIGLPGMPLTKAVIEARTSGHQLRRYRLSVSNGLVVTWGLDGLVFVRRPDTRDALLVAVTHHRNDGGVKSAVVTPSGKALVSLGYNHTIVCTALKKLVISGERLSVRATSDADWIKLLTTQPAPGNIAHGKSWMEQQIEKQLVQETVQFSATRRTLMKELTDIKAKTLDLLEKNYTCPDEERLEIREFDLDIEGRARATREAAEERSAYETRALALSAARDAMALKVKQHCWDTIEVKGRCIKAMAGNFEVNNYALLPKDLDAEKQLTSLIEARKVEVSLNVAEEFCPWKPTATNELTEYLHSSPLVEGMTEDLRQTLLADDDEAGRSSNSEAPEAEEVWFSSASHQFVEPSHWQSSQLAITTFEQIHNQVLFAKNVTHQLRVFFNKQFDETMGIKEREMCQVAERNERLRYILSELKNTTTKVINPEWHPHERPEMIITVEDKEVVAPPYVTPAEQARRDKLAAENEARRLAELADNFRERALIEMMDGVLEVRWEDIIKKDIPLPKCMIDRQPEDFTEEDLRTVREYEEKVAHLMNERERYKNMLEAEYLKVTTAVKEGMKKFDQKLADLHSLRLRVQAAICQEDLKVLRLRLLCQRRLIHAREEIEAQNAIDAHEERLDALRLELGTLHVTAAEGRAVYETLQAKDRQLEKLFRKEFSEVSQLVMDLLLKMYRRRPKGQGPRAHNAPTMLVETARCVTSHEQWTCLPTDCIEFLRAINHLDSPSAIPPALPDEHWPALCRARRQRIESEMRMKSCALEMADADAAISVALKQLGTAKEMAVTLAQQLQTLRDKKIEMATNIEIQLVLKQGLVEIPLTGRLSDFDDAILIKRYNIETVNKDIRSAGKKKLKAMTETMKFRRGIICMEWEHKSLKMEIEDLSETLHSIEVFKVSKEIQDILKRRHMGLAEEKGSITATMEKEMLNLRKYYERVFREIQAEVATINHQIDDKTRENKRLSKAIIELNVTVNEQQLRRDLKFEETEKREREERIAAIMQRSRLCSLIQKQHGDILLLQTELELLRLKTYPTLTYHTLS